jgi:hypothetical protein
MGEGGQGRKRQARLIPHRNTTPDRLLRCNQLGFSARSFVAKSRPAVFERDRDFNRQHARDAGAYANAIKVIVCVAHKGG